MRLALKAAAPSAIADDKSSRGTMLLNRGHARGLAQGFRRAEEHRQHDDGLNGNQIGKNQRRKQHRNHRGQNLAQLYNAHHPDAVGDRARQYDEQHHWHQIGKDDNPQPARGFGKLPGQPANRGALHPARDSSERIADPIGAVDRVFQGATGGAENR